jgi:uncharacterized membrane protein
MASYKSTVIKTLIWRVIATSITVGVGWVVSGDWRFGLAIGSIDTVFKTIGYFTFERMWLKYKK